MSPPTEPPLLDALRSRLSAKLQVARPRPAPAGTGRVFDHEPWARLLAGTSDGWSVDYADARTRRGELGAYLTALEHANPDALGRDEQLAFWINAYNAHVLAVACDARPDVSILEIPGVFTRRQVRVGGRGLTTDQIEHGIVRRLGDGRVHFGLNCASVGCPPLRAYEGGAVHEQLEENGRRYLGDEARGARADGDTLRLAMIFRWFAGDFAPVRGVPSPLPTLIGLARPARVLPAARDYLPPALAGLTKLGFIRWDWSLNRRGRAPG